ncbi:MAG: transglutaminase family protein, partial [Pseudomonadota bacterium]|nr:transglutaminase family protein [Pseudomonadota bacterium]
PYTDEQWDAVLALGRQVDAELDANDVRLTMGGEPTFVATADRDAAEWNIDALGPTKRGFATELLHKLVARYGKGGFLHFGQGKWYPGEQLPRWALTLGWRADGTPCWNDPTLFADERDTHRSTTEDAERFTTALTRRLGIDPSYIQPGYEDAWYYLWRERRLPTNVDPHQSRLDDPLERARLRRVFDTGLDAVVGYLLPLKRERVAGASDASWQSGQWFLRDERLYLMPGDSPMGYRLPLDSLPWAKAGERQELIAQDPFAALSPLPAAAAPPRQQPANALSAAVRSAAPTLSESDVIPTVPNNAGAGAHDLSPHWPANPPVFAEGRSAEAAPEAQESGGWLTRTALCVEVRDPQRANGPKAEAAAFAKSGVKSGVLYVFMPPLKHLEDFLELLAAIEAAAVETGVKLVLEGYPPPRDPRLKILQVTPDPGVIEVNIHPASNWDELVDHTEFLYDAAHRTRLSSEKFMLDGRHTGTGGGNHFVLGGATAADSPFLRRPDVLASLLTYWHNHPSLSYLFSGMFIGPTSQAPRIDEARNDQVYELEIALGELDRQLGLHEAVPPWVVDRSFRNLLIDVTGNTHRSEFCIDKLYSPDGPTGRLGLLELRAFEMPPHARMSLSQQLLLRALVAWFWREPYRGRGSTRLTRFGTGLHDRYMLPTFIQMDFEDVMADLQGAGYPFDNAWFAPHFEFRFPLIGEFAARGVQMSLRTALEPWHVMGEEGAPGGMARYVDSSLERVELKLTGFNDNRHVVTVNGRALPLQPTGRVGEFVCGVRYRAWQPPSALHPTIGIHAPLTFDLVDRWQQRSLGGCRYFVTHPGGLSHEDFPVNAYTAESRRLARFFRFGHTPGTIDVEPAQPSLEHPFTLDLRK